MSGDFTILKYEIKRLLFRKRNIFLAAILVLYSNYITEMFLNTYEYMDRYLRVKYSWGYSQLICLPNDLLYAIMVLLCLSVYSQKEKRAREIITACKISTTRYYMLKGAAIFAVFILFSAIPIGYTFVRCYSFYHFYAYYKFIGPIFLFVVPGAIMVFGLSMISGKIYSKLPYFYIPIIIFMGERNFLKLPNILDICGNDFFISHWVYLIKLPRVNGVERAYIIPMDFLWSRIIYVVAGIVLFCLTFIRKERIMGKLIGTRV